jgi:hypothetical protein
MTKDWEQGAAGHSGHSDQDIVEPTKDGPRPAREREPATYRKSKSDDLAYDGPQVPVPDLGPDALDEHGAPREARDDPPEPRSPDWHRQLAEWRHKWIAEGEKAEDVDDALRMTIREEISDPAEVEFEFERVMAEVFKTSSH